MNLNICNVVVLGALLLVVSGVRGQDSGCGGILNGTTGTAGFIASAGKVARSNCIWIISPDGRNEVSFTLKDISADSSILLYEVGQSAPLTTLGQDSIETSIKYAGKGFLAIFPVKSGSMVSFEWQTSGVADESLLFDAIYSEKNNDDFLREYFESAGSFALVASLEQKYENEVALGINLQGMFESPECQDRCGCLSADAFEVLPSGRLERLMQNRLCRGDRYDKLELNPQIVIWGNFKVPVPEADFFTFFANWFAAPTTTTKMTTPAPTTTTPGFANTIFANKALVIVGLFVLYLTFQRYAS